MRRQGKVLRIASLMALLLSGMPAFAQSSKSTDPSTKPETAEKPIATSPSLDGVQFAVFMQNETPAGLPIPIRVCISNEGTERVMITSSRSWYFDYYLVVKDSSGKIVPLTAYGKQKTDGRFDGIRSASFDPKARSEVRTNLSLFNDLTLPGDYTLKVSRNIRVGIAEPRKIVTITTDEIRFKVTPVTDVDVP